MKTFKHIRLENIKSWVLISFKKFWRIFYPNLTANPRNPQGNLKEYARNPQSTRIWRIFEANPDASLREPYTVLNQDINFHSPNMKISLFLVNLHSDSMQDRFFLSDLLGYLHVNQIISYLIIRV